ncbi:MAG: hypothetical protein ACM34G_17260 [Acidobacteriota bacterium]
MTIWKYWVSCERYTCQVNVDQDSVIRWTAPFLHKFIGQRLVNLLHWSKTGAYQIEELP